LIEKLHRAVLAHEKIAPYPSLVTRGPGWWRPRREEGRANFKTTESTR
jgi:hypothetical protein